MDGDDRQTRRSVIRVCDKLSASWVRKGRLLSFGSSRGITAAN